MTDRKIIAINGFQGILYFNGKIIEERADSYIFDDDKFGKIILYKVNILYVRDA